MIWALFTTLLMTLASTKPSAPIVLAVDRWPAYGDKLLHKKVALVVNQASVTGQGEHTLDYLLRQGVQVEKLFALEHGIRGEGGAGEEIPDSRDPKTGIPIVSLYGPNKKPSPEVLRGIDLVVYDIQDVGVRFYTYISSLGLIMQACAENKVGVLILDRPNPNGDYIAGPVLKPENLSFVGAYPIPVVYGMTVGELAGMIQGKDWKQTRGLDLQVIALKNYRHQDLYIPQVWPSAGLKNSKSIRSYPTVALFEPTVMNYGGGTSYPFLQYCYPDEKLGPYSYVPMRQTPTQRPRHEGLNCYGQKFFDLEYERIPKFTTHYFSESVRILKLKEFVTDLRFFKLLVGDSRVAEALLEGTSANEIDKMTEPGLARFKRDQQKYLIYPR